MVLGVSLSQSSISYGGMYVHIGGKSTPDMKLNRVLMLFNMM